MKKYICLLALATVVFFACTKESTTQDPSGSLHKLTFTGITDDSQLKTTLGSDYSIVWSTEDDITVFPGDNAAGVQFDVTATARDGREATFEGSAATASTYYALSPAQASASIVDGKITANLPTTQTASAGSFAPEANISVASASDYVFQFKNMGALVGVSIDQDGITGIKLEAIGGEQLTGSVTINPADGEITSRNGGESFAELTGSFSSGSTYYFAILPGIYTQGFRITLYKDSQYASFKKGDRKGIGRNDNFTFGLVHGNKWKTTFAVGEDMVIKESAEDGRALAYVASSGYWNGSIQYSDVDGYAYNYEIFTRLTKDQKFYFKAARGESFTLNAAGTAVERLTSVANAPYGAPADGIYRIRLNMPDGAAEIKQISEVKYDIYGLDSRVLDYQGNGVWSKDSFLMRTDSYMNRYRFLVKFTDDTKQYYGRMSSNTGKPIYGVTPDDYFYVQPSTDQDDHWSPCFQYQNTFEGNYTRYYCTMTLSLNNDNGHYTHAISGISDNVDASSDIIYIIGSSEECQEMVHLRSGYYNTAMEGFGDNSALVSDAIGDYDYEIFTRLESGQKFCFYNYNTGTFYAPTADGSAIQSIATPSDATYSISTGGAWRIRANFSTGKVNIRRIDQVRTELNYDGGADGAVHVLSYDGKGKWKKDNAVIKWHSGQYGRTNYSEYVVKIWFNRNNVDSTIDAWQVYGATSTKSGSPDPSDDGSYWNVQPYTGDGWNRVFFYPSWTIDGSNNGRYTATISLYMNNAYGRYTHRFTNVTDTL